MSFARFPLCNLAGWIAVTALVLPAYAAASLAVRSIDTEVSDVLLNSDWTYYELAATDPAQLKDAGAPIPVDLPHTWNATDSVDAEPGYRRDAAWYRKRLAIDEGSVSQRYKLHFEGANMTASVYVNGEHAGGHVGGYLGFEVDITDQLRAGDTNEILVRVDNGINRSIIPSQKADFVLYGGLTRDVFLRVRPLNHVASVQIDTPEVSRDSAQVQATVRLERHEPQASASRLHVEVLDGTGTVVSLTRTELPEDQAANEHVIKLPTIPNPALWSPDAPNLYTLTATLESRDGEVLHQQKESFGLRWFGFADNGSFMLNGERLLLRGTHRHEEHAGFRRWW